jgi:hypothetical protein
VTKEMKMLSDVYFYMTEEDIRDILGALATSEPVQFVPVQRYSDPKEVAVYDLAEVPNLGVARYGYELSEDRLLVMPKGATVGTLRIDHTDKTVSYDVVSAHNPDSLILWAAGKFGDKCIIRGHFAPSSDSPFAVNLYRRLKALMKEKCVLANRHFLGERALQRLREGAILSSAATAKPSCHFRLPE